MVAEPKRDQREEEKLKNEPQDEFAYRKGVYSQEKTPGEAGFRQESGGGTSDESGRGGGSSGSRSGGRGASERDSTQKSDQEIPKKYYHISAVSRMYDIHPQTLRLYEREGLLKPTRSEGNTRLYTDEDLERLEVILTLTRDLGVNLAGVEIILNMREKMARLEEQINQLLDYVRREFFEGREEEFEAKKEAIIRLSPIKMVKWSESERLIKRKVDEGDE